jgi:putative DNA primase/helicase
MNAVMTPHRFSVIAEVLHAGGYKPIPILPGEKRPAVDRWTEYVYRNADVRRFAEHGVGLLCGELRAIDIDVRNEDVSIRIANMAASMLWPDSKAPRRIGQWPKALFMVRSVPGAKMSTAPYILDSDTFDNDPHKVEVLGQGQQFVAYGIHPKTGREYEWNGAGEPTSVRLEDLPYVTPEQLRAFLAAAEGILGEFGKRCGRLGRGEDGKVHRPAGDLRGDYATVVSALAYIPNDNVSRDDWVEMMHAIKGALGEEGLDVWLRWSASSPKSGKSGKKDTALKAWQDCNPTSIGAGTIYFWAKHNGWKRPAKAAPQMPADWDEVPPQTEAAGRTAEKLSSRSLILLNGADVKPEPIEWLWDGWLAAGKLHILAGVAGTGKTTLAMSLAATLSRGGRWTDGTQAQPGSVVVASYEDDPADTLAPRLRAAGADMDRIKFLAGVWQGTERTAFSAREDGALLADAIRTHGVRLLIIDPIISAMGAFDSHKNAETRTALQPLADIAAETGVAIVGIAHFTKGTGGRDPLERVSGSLAFGAVARVVMGAATTRDEDGEEARLFVRVKSNIGPDSGGFSYSLERKEVVPGVFGSCVMWGTPVEGSARELLAEPDGNGEESPSGEIESFVRDELADGPITASEFRKDAEGAGHQWHTVQRIAKKLGAESRKCGMKGPWRWGFYGSPKATSRPEDDEGDTAKCLSSSASSAVSVSSSGAMPSDAEVF